MGLKSKFWVLTLAIVLALLLLLGYLLFNFWTQLPQEARVHIWQVTRNYFGLLFLIGLFVVMGFLFLLNEIFQNYILPLSRISEEIELISIVNPAHRINVEGGREIRRMVEQINKAADKLQFLQQQLRQKHQPDAGLSKDRQTLASLFTRLPLGVVVCNQRCKVLLYNKKAEELLCRCNSGSEETNECSLSLGLGRSLSAFLDPDQLSKAIQDLHGQMESHVEEPVAHLLVPQARGPDITAQMVCILDEADAILGYALFLHAQADYCLLDRPGSASMQNVPKPGFETKMQRIDGLQSCRPCTYDFHLLYRPQKESSLDRCELSDLSYTVFDLETTGLDPLGGDEIVSVSGVRIFNSRIVPGEHFDRLINPNRPIGPESTRIHGITEEMIKNEPGVGQVLSQFWGFARDTVLVAYCADFDLTFLQLKEQNIGVKFENPVLDILLLSLYVHPGQKDHSLQGMARRLGSRVYSRHTSLGDALTTAEIYLQLIPLLQSKGVHTLRQARAVTEQVKYVGPRKEHQVMPVS